MIDIDFEDVFIDANDDVRHFTHEDIEKDVELYGAIAETYLHDIIRKDLERYHAAFINAMLFNVKNGVSLSIPMIRGTINVIGGAIKANRRRFYKSRKLREGSYPCIVCGAGLRKESSVNHRIGDRCYYRLTQRWMYQTGDQLGRQAESVIDDEWMKRQQEIARGWVS